MKLSRKVSLGVLAVVGTLGVAGLVKAAVEPVPLGNADGFAVLAGAGITNTGPTTITGDIGTFATLTETGFASITLTGTNHIGDTATQNAKSALVTAYGTAAGEVPPTTTYPAIHDLGGETLTAGIYNDPSSFGITGTLTLSGDSNSVFVFQAGSTLITASNSKVVLNGVDPCNIFWQVGSSATLGTNSIFKGNILALESITLNTGANVAGRVLARNGAVTMDTNIIAKAVCGVVPPDPSAPTCTLTANPISVTTGSPSVLSWTTTDASAFSIDNSVGSVTPVAAGSSSVSPITTTLYTGTVTGAGGSIQCAATVTITPTSTASSGGSSASSGGSSGYSFLLPPLINVTKIPNPLALPAGPGSVAYTYAVTNLGSVPMTGVTVIDNKCSPVNFISGDTNVNAQLDVAETWTYRCTAALATTTTNRITATGHANGFTAIDTADATVVVGASIIPPLIHVVKVPSTFVLPASGGAVTYSYTVTNPGTVPLSDVTITDDKCTGLPGRVVGHPGDLNKNNLLESNEVWQFTCKTNLTQTTTNTATASGHANGLIVYDFSPATVVVAPYNVAFPKLPETGIPPSRGTVPWDIFLSAGILILVSTSLVRALKKS